MEWTELGIRLREARKKKGFTQQMLADAVDVTEVYISQLERGMKLPSLVVFIQIVNALDVSADYILRDAVHSGKDFVYEEVAELLDGLTPKQRRGAIDILDAYVQSL